MDFCQKTMRLSVFRCAVLALVPALAFGDDYFRCGQSLISPDVSVAELIQKCGNPTSKRVSFVAAHNEYGYTVATVKVETWRYDRGARAAAMVVTVTDGKIQKIESEGSGD